MTTMNGWLNSENWWKAPVLQGPENDYGDYDYLCTEIPNYREEWEKFDQKCSYCGKYHKLNLVTTSYFYTLDGYDSISDTMCWRCYIKEKIARILNKIRRKLTWNRK